MTHEALEALATIAEYTDIDVQDILDSLAENTGDKDLALAAHLNTLDVEPVYGDDTFRADGGEYLVLDDSEADEREDQCLECLLEDGCVEGADSPYFDREKWKDDARTAGRGHIISGYDGNEEEYGDYFIYRIN